MSGGSALGTRGDILIASWTAPNELSLSRAGSTPAWSSPCSADARYDVRLVAARSGAWLRTADGLASVGPDLVPSPVHPPTEGPAAPAHGWRILADDRPALLEGDRLHLREGSGAWSSMLPATGFTAHDACASADGAVWVAGALASDRVPGAATEAAVFRVASGVPERVPHNLPARSLARLIKGGALEALDCVEAWAPPIVLASRTAWFLDDPSSWLVVHGRGRPRVHRLADRTVRGLHRAEDGCVVATAEGDVLRVDADGKLTTIVASAALADAIGEQAAGATLYLRGVDVRAAGLTAVVGVAGQGADRLVWHATALISVTTGGRYIDVVHRTWPQRDQPELLDCVTI